MFNPFNRPSSVSPSVYPTTPVSPAGDLVIDGVTFSKQVIQLSKFPPTSEIVRVTITPGNVGFWTNFDYEDEIEIVRRLGAAANSYDYLLDEAEGFEVDWNIPSQRLYVVCIPTGDEDRAYDVIIENDEEVTPSDAEVIHLLRVALATYGYEMVHIEDW